VVGRWLNPVVVGLRSSAWAGFGPGQGLHRIAGMTANGREVPHAQLVIYRIYKLFFPNRGLRGRKGPGKGSWNAC
jgi:hypothetical protein